MKSTKSKPAIVFLLIMSVLIVQGCFPSKRAVPVNTNSLRTRESVTTPAKVFLRDSSLVIFNQGFSISGDSVEGMGTRYWLTHHDSLQTQRIPVNGIAAVTSYEKNQTEGMLIGSGLMAITGAIMAPLSIYCLSCPKCCFGSCPTVFTTDGKRYALEAELFSYSLSKFFQDTDTDRIIQKPAADGTFTIRLTNEALETHYINQFNLLAVRHDAGTEVYPTPEGGTAVVKKLHAPMEALDSEGGNISSLISRRDTSWVTGISTRFDEAENSKARDWLDMKLAVPDSAKQATLVLRLRNSLLSTVLFYDVVLASQGVGALEWNHRLNTDSLYAAFYHMAYSQFAGIEVEAKSSGGTWKQIASFGDVGPLAWKELALQLPVVRDENGEMWIRLQWFPENFIIDYAGYDYGTYKTPEIEQVNPKSITDHRSRLMNEIWQQVEYSDGEFLTTYPGDSYYFYYVIPDRPETTTTLFLKSKGYYTEWLRGNWISRRNRDYTFNLFEEDKTLEQLKRSWRADRELLERTFFQTRIPLKERQLK
ncbi:MAG TPA: hypothetical protein VJ964_03800 [Balneolaceae bacterium]|nr:hypothetical protein [Balneolaceae bacterium]